ncbi:GNAT family N-acetyltransferase [Asanoa siamensis]|uniref:N-acetyltransferase domain-containing protein n=1 Tax=Asanoa siamensis TaxID=926357 RepID=A0ABQ4CUK4_9ACTN|nr:GNAT family N-acetyltransferase [Asanoa siamensis]GIF74983.1 hypothetical protein Asi02nite_45010 [Asanoa siamensis]
MPDLGPVAWPPAPIRTARLTLRESEARDRPAYIELSASPEVNTYVGGGRPRDVLEREVPQVPGRRPGFFVVDLDGEMIGTVMLTRRDVGPPDRVRPEAGEVDLGYLFLPTAWGHGYAAEASRAALAWFAGALPGEPVVLCTQTANEPSMRLARKLGFTEAARFEAWEAEQWFGVWSPPTPTFPDLLRLIDERVAAFRAAIGAAPDLDERVPTCPEWTLSDLARHLGEGRHAWAATVAAGPGATGRSTETGPPAPREREALLAWLAESTQELLAALRAAGPERGCWTWWGDSQSPRTCGAVARHQLQEIAVHTYDAQVALGAPRPLPADVALDGVDEFLTTCVATTAPWPHEPVAVEYHATEGRSWRLSLDADGARVGPPGGPTGATLTGSASDLVLVFYGRVPREALTLDGDRRHLDRLVDWDPGA